MPTNSPLPAGDLIVILLHLLAMLAVGVWPPVVLPVFMSAYAWWAWAAAVVVIGTACALVLRETWGKRLPRGERSPRPLRPHFRYSPGVHPKRRRKIRVKYWLDEKPHCLALAATVQSDDSFKSRHAFSSRLCIKNSA